MCRPLDDVMDVVDELHRMRDRTHCLYLATIGAEHEGSEFDGPHAQAIRTVANDVRRGLQRAADSLEKIAQRRREAA